MPTLVSVIIPSYNRKQFLLEAIASVQAQTYPHIELIVVDDGSSDGTREALKGFALRYVYQENKGVSAARNAGAQLAKGTYLCFLDSDDSYRADYVEQKLALAEKTNAGLIGGGCCYFGDGQGGNSARASITYDDMCIFTAFPGGTNNIFVLRSLFEAVGGFDTQLKNSEDRDLLRRLLEKTRVSSVDAPLVKVRLHQAERGSGRNVARVAQDREKVAMKITSRALRRRARAWDLYMVGNLYWRENAKGKALVSWLRSFAMQPFAIHKEKHRVSVILNKLLHR